MKSVVWNSPFQVRATSVETGIEFVSGVAQEVTDEQAAKLISNPHFSVVQASAPKVEVKAVDAA